MYRDPVYTGFISDMLDAYPVYKKDFIYSDSLVQYMQELSQGNKFPVRLPARLPTTLV